MLAVVVLLLRLLLVVVAGGGGVGVGSTQGVSAADQAKERLQFDKDVRVMGEKFIAELQSWESQRDAPVPLSIKKYFGRVCAGIPASFTRSEVKNALAGAAAGIVQEYVLCVAMCACVCVCACVRK